MAFMEASVDCCPVYYVGFHLVGVICLVPWIVNSRTYGPILGEDGVNRVWW
jgi:hypothetical protein